MPARAQEIRLSLIVPTIGRVSLKVVLAQLRQQMTLVDEVLVIGDGPVGMRDTVQSFGGQFRYYEHGPDHVWGYPQREYALAYAQGSHLMFVDDDDRLCPDALRNVREALTESPTSPHLFRMYHHRTSIWRKRELIEGNIATQMFVLPKSPGRFGAWGRRYAGDFDFIVSTIGLYPAGSLIWNSNIIVVHGVGGKLPHEAQ